MPALAPPDAASSEVVESLKKKLLLPGTSLPSKYRVLFSLRNVPGQEAQDALAAGLKDPSALFRHDVAFCLGQRQEAGAIRVLSNVLRDVSEHSMVRHEAAEALGAIGTPECLEILEEFREDPVREVSETCSLALQRIEDLRDRMGEIVRRDKEGVDACGEASKDATEGNQGEDKSPYLSVDPTPAAPASTPTDELKAMLVNEEASMFDRYRALFALRNRGGADQVSAIGAAFKCKSALLKHEVAYVLGQMQDPSGVEYLKNALRDESEHAMVRHEAAEALGSISEDSCVALLREFLKDPEPIVAESCVVALDVLEHNTSGEFQYADLGPSHVS